MLNILGPEADSRGGECHLGTPELHKEWLEIPDEKRKHWDKKPQMCRPSCKNSLWLLRGWLRFYIFTFIKECNYPAFLLRRRKIISHFHYSICKAKDLNNNHNVVKMLGQAQGFKLETYIIDNFIHFHSLFNYSVRTNTHEFTLFSTFADFHLSNENV